MSKYFTGYETVKLEETEKEKCKSVYYICSFWSPLRHSTKNYVFYIQIMLFEISKNLGRSSVTHILLAVEQTTKKSKYTKLRFSKINPCEKSTGRQCAKLNPREMLKKWLA